MLSRFVASAAARLRGKVHVGTDPAGEPIFEDRTELALAHIEQNRLDALGSLRGAAIDGCESPRPFSSAPEPFTSELEARLAALCGVADARRSGRLLRGRSSSFNLGVAAASLPPASRPG